MLDKHNIVLLCEIARKRRAINRKSDKLYIGFESVYA